METKLKYCNLHIHGVDERLRLGQYIGKKQPCILYKDDNDNLYIYIYVYIYIYIYVVKVATECRAINHLTACMQSVWH